MGQSKFTPPHASGVVPFWSYLTSPSFLFQFALCHSPHWPSPNSLYLSESVAQPQFALPCLLGGIVPVHSTSLAQWTVTLPSGQVLNSEPECPKSNLVLLHCPDRLPIDNIFIPPDSLYSFVLQNKTPMCVYMMPCSSVPLWVYSCITHEG